MTLIGWFIVRTIQYCTVLYCTWIATNYSISFAFFVLLGSLWFCSATYIPYLLQYAWKKELIANIAVITLNQFSIFIEPSSSPLRRYQGCIPLPVCHPVCRSDLLAPLSTGGPAWHDRALPVPFTTNFDKLLYDNPNPIQVVILQWTEDEFLTY